MIRRRALHVLLLHLDALRLGGTHLDDPRRLAEIAQYLGELQAYQALRPLEKLDGHPHPTVRRGVMKALRNLYFKRTFALIQRGLRDEAKEVSDAAVEALESLHFPHAFDPLARIFHEHADMKVKITALTSIGRIATIEAGEFLIEVLKYEHEPLKDVARRLLAGFENPEIHPILRRHYEVETGQARSDLAAALRGATR
jgi:HEAT repeat protein